MKPARNKEFLNFAARTGGECCLCGDPAVDLHHFGSQGGMGMKPSDYWVARVCRKCHAKNQGKRKMAYLRGGTVFVYYMLLEDAMNLAEKYMESELR